jgi:hypothetical protein
MDAVVVLDRAFVPKKGERLEDFIKKVRAAGEDLEL